MLELNRLLTEQQVALQRDIFREAKEKEVFEKIAKNFLDIETLDTRNRDALDFHVCGVGALRAALKAAYDAGMKEARNAV